MSDSKRKTAKFDLNNEHFVDVSELEKMLSLDIDEVLHTPVKPKRKQNLNGFNAVKAFRNAFLRVATQ